MKSERDGKELVSGKASVLVLSVMLLVSLASCGGGGGGGGGEEIAPADTPAVPSNLTLTASSPTGVALSWDAASGASGYKVYRNGAFAASVSALTYTDSGLSLSTYCYAITSYDGAGIESARSAEVCTSLLAGTLQTSLMAAGAGDATWWERGTTTVYIDNSAASTTVNSRGQTATVSGSVVRMDNGAVSFGNGRECYGDSGNTVMHGTTVNGDDTVGIFTVLKKAVAYSTADIEGAWKVNILTAGPSSPWWERGTLTVSASGAFTADTIDLYGEAGYLTEGGTMSISEDGTVTIASFPTLSGRMDAGKTVIVWTDTWHNGTSELAVLTRLGSDYSTADLEGTWKFSTLSTGIAPSTAKGTAVIGPDGSASIEFQNSEGSSGSAQRGMAVASDGAVSIDGFPEAVGAMDSDKTVIVFTEKLVTVDTVLSDIIIFTKQ